MTEDVTLRSFIAITCIVTISSPYKYATNHMGLILMIGKITRILHDNANRLVALETVMQTMSNILFSLQGIVDGLPEKPKNQLSNM